ncbi:MAG: ABC transporter permease [Limisphaerales bacterium]
MTQLRFVLRQLWRQPGFTALAVLTLALGIGANTAIFSVVHAVLLRPFPYPDSGQIVFLSGTLRTNDSFSFPLNFADLEDFRAQAAAFEGLGGTQDEQFTVTGVTEPSRVKGAYLMPAVLELLRVPPVVGRPLLPADDQPGAPRVCVLADRAWERFFQRRPDVVGQTLLLNGNPHEVVGVMPPAFKFWDAWVYVPLVHGIPPELRTMRGVRTGMWGIGRLRPGVTPEQAAQQLDVVAGRIAAEHPAENGDATVRARPLAETVGSRIRPTLLLLFGAVGCVLLIACVNVANLLLARGAARGRELAVRAALGASRGRLAGQLLLETLPLGLLAAVVGVLFAVAGLRFLLSQIPPELVPAEADIRLSLPVLAFTAGVGVVAALLAGVLPAVQASRRAVHDALKEGARSAGGLRGAWVRGALVTAEVALALALLVTAGLLVRNLVQVARTDPGFLTEHLLVSSVQLPEARYPDPDRAEAFVRELLERTARYPGVRHAGVLTVVPMGGGSMNLPLLLDGRAYTRQDDLRSVIYNAVTPGAIEALGLRLGSGRLPDANDHAGAERVVVLNAAAARQFFGHEDPVGRRVAAGIPRALLGDRPAEGVLAAIVDPPFARVIGVVSDSRQYGLMNDPQPEIFVPFGQSFRVPPVRNGFALLLRTADDPGALAGTLRQDLRGLDPDLPLDAVRTMEAMVAETLRSTRFLVVLLGLFAAVALVLAALGIYGVVGWLVNQRTREMGIRLALGAPPAGVIGLVVRQGLRPVLLGLLLGGGLAFALTRAFASLLPDAVTADAATYLAVAVLLAAVAALACWLPARRASRVDPMIALRAE